MSHFTEVQTQFKDLESLIAALEECMPAWKGLIEVHAEAQPLHGYRGDVRAQKAHVIIRKQHVGSASNDLGFERLPNGTFVARISEYDQARYGAKWMEKATDLYGLHTTIKVMGRRGYRMTRGTNKQGELQLRCEKL